MPRPFPFPINVGTDICSVQRIFRILAEKERSSGHKFIKRILTKREYDPETTRFSHPLRRWWKLQTKREQLGAGFNQVLWDINNGNRTRRTQSQGSFEDAVARGFEDQKASDLGPAHEASAIDIPANLSNTENVKREDTAASELSNEPSSCILASPRLATVQETASADTISGGETTVVKEQLESEGARTSTAATISASIEAATIRDKQKKKKDNAPIPLTLQSIDDELNRVYPDVRKVAEFLAGRFAAKEAAIKAYQSRRLTYHDIMVLKQPERNGMSQKPITLVVSEDGDWDDAQIIPMSISHDGGFATAVCMAYEKSSGANLVTAEDIEKDSGARAEHKAPISGQTRHYQSLTE